MIWEFYSRSVAIAAILAAANVFSEPALAQTTDGSAICWVNTGTGKVYTAQNLPPGTTETVPGERSGGGHEYAQAACPPPPASPPPPPAPTPP